MTDWRPRMPTHRIAVGLNGSGGARDALTWALRLAARRSAAVLVVTAWPDSARAVSRARDTLRPDRLALIRMQQSQIAEAAAGMRHLPTTLFELVLSDPVTALCHAAASADLVVVGATRPGRRERDSIVAELETRLAAAGTHGRRVPPVVVVNPEGGPRAVRHARASATTARSKQARSNPLLRRPRSAVASPRDRAVAAALRRARLRDPVAGTHTAVPGSAR
ncbi:universal stress protein [Plantactinospora sp. KLBMP9567]|uniref:universal stress protein n=1 Tax=Plantactinospora sp. KLBMP9567 TaxID=3085900 RepID=UPI0039905236